MIKCPKQTLLTMLTYASNLIVLHTLISVSNQRRKKLQKLNRYRLNKYKNEVYYELQRDSSDTSVTNLCSRQPSINSRYSCDRKQKGYYYDGLKDACVRFKGCHQTGDFFGRRKDCKRACMKKDNFTGKHNCTLKFTQFIFNGHGFLSFCLLDDWKHLYSVASKFGFEKQLDRE